MTGRCWPSAWPAPSGSPSWSHSGSPTSSACPRAARHHPAQQDRPGRRRRHHCHPRGTPAAAQRAARRLARARRDLGWVPVPPAGFRACRRGNCLVHVRPRGGVADASPCYLGRLRCGGLCRALVAGGFPDSRRTLRRVRVQDARGLAPQVHAGAGRLRPRCQPVSRPCRRGLPIECRLSMYRCGVSSSSAPELWMRGTAPLGFLLGNHCADEDVYGLC